MNNYEIIEDPLTSLNETREAIEQLVFEEKKNPETIANSFRTAELNGTDPKQFLDGVARRRLRHMYTHRNQNTNYPTILKNWKGDATEGTPQLLRIARGEDHPDRYQVEKYQQTMRANIPNKIPLVRGGSQNSKMLESWAAEIGVARRYSDGQLLFTIANPEDVFMCSKFGPRIGEQEYTLTNKNSIHSYTDSNKTHIKLYQKMDQIL